MESEAEREMKQRRTQTALRNDEKERNTNPLESISLYPCRVSSLHRFLSVSFSFDPLLALLCLLTLFPAAFSILQHLSTPFQTVFSPYMFPLPLQCFLRRPSLERMALAIPLSRQQGGVVRHVHGRPCPSLFYDFSNLENVQANLGKRVIFVRRQLESFLILSESSLNSFEFNERLNMFQDKETLSFQ